MIISFVIPCYRSEKTIEGVIDEIIQVMSIRPHIDFEIICVNDYSPDDVYLVLQRIADKVSKVKVINFAKNFGKASAILAGYSKCQGDVIITLDDDGQCPVDKTWDLVDALDESYDMAMADYPEKKESLFKRIGSKVNHSMMNFLIDQPEGICMNNFSATKRFVAEEMTEYKNPYPALHPLVLQATHSFKMISMEERCRADDNASGFTFWKSFCLMINGFTNFSVKPLRLATLLGFISAIVGFIYVIYLVIIRLVNPEMVAGYASLMAILLLIGGIIMILLGIIGEYLGRIYICINKSPQYVIRDNINFD